MPKGVPNKRYTGEFKQEVVETMIREKLSYGETARRFEVNSLNSIQSWERIYLEEGTEGFNIERRGRARKIDNAKKRSSSKIREKSRRRFNSRSTEITSRE